MDVLRESSSCSSYLAILGSTPFFSSRRLMVTGSVAEEDAVPKAVVKAFAMLAMNLQCNPV